MKKKITIITAEHRTDELIVDVSDGNVWRWVKDDDWFIVYDNVCNQSIRAMYYKPIQVNIDEQEG